MNYFFDANLSPDLVQAMAVLHGGDHPEDSFFHIDDLFPAGTGDNVWIDDLMARTIDPEQWAIVTRDQMRQHWPQVQASGFFWFILDGEWGRAGYWEIAWRLVRAWPGITQAVDRTGGGRMARQAPPAAGRIFSVNPESDIHPRLSRA